MRQYRLIEIAAGKPLAVEHFSAPDDDEAIRRVRDVVEDAEYELWRAGVLIERHEAPGSEDPAD